MALLRFSAALLGCRFDDLRRREAERRKRRLLVAASTSLAIAVALAGLAVFAFRERNLKAEALREVLRLSDSKKIRDLIAEEATLWPIHPDVAPRMRDWLRRMEVVLTRLPDHEESLRRLRRQGEQSVADAWMFESDDDAWRHAVLSGVVEDLNQLSSSTGLLSSVRARHAQAKTLRERSVGAFSDEWREAAKRVAASSAYDGLVLSPQIGLVPLGPDPMSGFEEFAHLGSGSMPERSDAGELEYVEDSSIVLVLIPGGNFWMGAQREDPDERNFDRHADADESPVHKANVEAFFMGKHEVTQAQWMALTGGANPSQHKAGTGEKRPLTGRNPVERVSWADCAGLDGRGGWLDRHRLCLPTETQWEYACRAGNATAWWNGDDTLQISRVANVADEYLKAHGGSRFRITAGVNDGHAVHAPVGTFAANPYGLHDTHGNVWEWCEDVFHLYTRRDAPEETRLSVRVFRGGSWSYIAQLARSADRFRNSPGIRNHDLGVRAARRIDG